MVDLAIIADDLTGALDAAAPFASRSIRTVVALRIGALAKALASGANIVSVSTDSRDMPPADAMAAVRSALALLPPGTPIFKKVDSRLKGNITAELDAIPHARSLVAPAIPEFGRITRNGHILGFGVPAPIDIAVRLGPHAAMASIPDIAAPGDFDYSLSQPHDLAVGARGLADAMARRMAPHAKVPAIPLLASQAFCIVGSTDPITLAQLENLRSACPGLADIGAPNGVAPSSTTAPASLTLIQATPGAVPASGHAVAAALAASLLRLSPPADALLLLSGGATAQLILEALGVDSLDLLGEILPGLPIARAGDLTVITKSGGFGEPDSLSRVLGQYCSQGSVVQAHVG